jgi:hypothetical protein
MNSLRLLSLAIALLAGPSMAQLTPGSYLVGTMGWDQNWAVSTDMDTIQLLDPYNGNANQLKVKGIPKGESPSSILIEMPTTFLLGTKTRSAPAAGNIYRVTHVSGNDWSAAQLNTSPLKINVSVMARSKGLLYVIGSATFGRYAEDTQILSIGAANGEVKTWLALGADFLPGGARGIGSSILIRGDTMHAFTFDTRDSTTSPTPPIANEHWSIHMKTGAITQLPDLPLSRRTGKNGFGTSGSHWDPTRNLIMVTGRFGEIVWRDEKGVDQEFWVNPAPWTGANTNVWRCATVNHDTWALAFGDHEAEIDELRGGGSGLAMRAKGLWVQHGVVKAIKPIPGYLSFCVAEYISTTASYQPVSGACPEATGNLPCSYIRCLPLAPEPEFALDLYSKAPAAAALFGGKIQSLELSGIGAPGCILGLEPIVVMPAWVKNGVARLPYKIPPGKHMTVYVQWLTLDAQANSLGAAFSCTRKLVIR